ncbi:MAG TPA: hypothetical protein VGW10_09675 [Solirubrobacteraceae bacterium]|nr:hypothetical protein [Solirubrobacteraceae bacterium]
MGLLRSAGTGCAVAMAAGALSACGEEQREDTTPALSSPRVAMTASYPGYAPFALITYRDGHGRVCHGLGSVTPDGPRVMGALDMSLGVGLAKHGTCLRREGRDVSVQIRRAGGGARIVGGIARAGVTRVLVAGQSVRTRRNGEFLVVQPSDAGPVGDEIELEYHAGHHRRLPLRLVTS